MTEQRIVAVAIETDASGEKCLINRCGLINWDEGGSSCRYVETKEELDDWIDCDTRPAACRAAEIRVDEDVRIIAESIIEHYEGPEDCPTRLLVIIKDYIRVTNAIATAAGRGKQ